MSSSKTDSFGLLLIGHGTRDKAGIAEIKSLANSVRDLLPLTIPVELCYLEIAEPTINAGIEKLVTRGNRIVVAPLLLFEASHAKRDVPEMLEAALQANPNLRFSSLPPVWVASRILRLSQERLLAAKTISLKHVASYDSRQTTSCSSSSANPSTASRMLLVIGRGSSDRGNRGTTPVHARRAAQAAVE